MGHGITYRVRNYPFGIFCIHVYVSSRPRRMFASRDVDAVPVPYIRVRVSIDEEWSDMTERACCLTLCLLFSYSVYDSLAMLFPGL